MKDESIYWENLLNHLIKADQAYYELSDPIMLDSEYDTLRQSLTQALQSAVLIPSLRTAIQHYLGTVGTTPQRPTGFEKHGHLKPMLSLANVYNSQDVEDYQKRTHRFLKEQLFGDFEFYADIKVDGISLSLIYQEGHLIRAVTRGDGHTGEIVTSKALLIRDIPPTLPSFYPLIEVRGEVYFELPTFKSINEILISKGEKPFANARNAASGTLRTLEANHYAHQLSFFAWDLIPHQTPLTLTTQFQKSQYLTELGFKITPAKVITQLSEWLEWYQEQLNQRSTWSFEADGLVYKLNNLALQEEWGYVDRSPRFAVAYKFPALEGTTKLQAIQYQVGRTGVITPVAVIEPIRLAGALLSHASLFNFEQIKRLDLNIGDTVTVTRSGDVIPQIIGVDKRLRTGQETPIAIPTCCPECQGEVGFKKDLVALYCLNPECKKQHIQGLIYAVSRQGFNIEGLADKQVEQFYEKGIIQELSHIFQLKQRIALLNYPPLEEWQGYGTLSANKLYQAIEKARSVSLDRWLYALGLPHVGKMIAADLARFYPDISQWKAIFCNPELLFELKTKDGFGEIILTDIVNHLKQPKVVDKIHNLLSESPPFIKTSEGFLKDYVFVFTGRMSISREEAKNLVESFGGIVDSGINKKVNIVVAGEDAGSKLEKARKYDLRVINEDEFRIIIERENINPLNDEN